MKTRTGEKLKTFDANKKIFFVRSVNLDAKELYEGVVVATVMYGEGV